MKFLPAYYNLGALFLAQKKYILAEEYLKQRIEMGSPTDQWTLRAQEMIEELYDLCPELHEGVLQQMSDDLDKDLARQKIIQRQETETRKLIDIEKIYNDGTASFNNGDYWLAISLFEEALAFDPDRSDVRSALERANAQLRRQKAAAELDTSVQQYKPAIMEMYLNEAEQN